MTKIMVSMKIAPTPIVKELNEKFGGIFNDYTDLRTADAMAALLMTVLMIISDMDFEHQADLAAISFGEVCRKVFETAGCVAELIPNFEEVLSKPKS